MTMIHTGSELIETLFTPEERNIAMQLMDKNLSYQYLQNSRVQIFRQLAAQDFTKPAEDLENIRIRAYMKGQLDLLETLCNGILEPDPVPLQQPSQSSNQFTRQGA